MRNKLILFLMLALFGSMNFLKADEVQIGEGTATNNYLPSYSLYNYSLTQQIYTADEIGVGECTINSIAFYNDGDEKTRDYTMYLVNTDKEAFSGITDWFVVTAADEVFTGSVTMAEDTWTVFTLSTPFAYTGGNLAVIMDDNTGSWSSGMKCLAFPASNQALRIYSDPTNYDPFSPAGYSGTMETSKNQIVLDVTVSTPGPVIPTGEFGITPSDEFALNYRPKNGWMEPFAVRIYNGGEPTVVSASMSNTSEQNPFLMPEILDMTIETGDAFDFEIEINTAAPADDYTEEFTMFYATSGKDIITIPVTGTIYTAVAPDIVEKPTNVAWSSNAYNAKPTMDNIHPNYNLYGMTEMKPDAVYKFTMAQDYRISVNTVGADFVAIYKNVPNLHLTAEVEPVLLGTGGIIDDEVILAGQYYLVVAGDDISDISMTRVEIPAPTEITYVDPSPANYAHEVTAPITLAWEGGTNATQYQVLFGTVAPPTEALIDWTMIDENYGSVTIEELAANTEYFWQVKVKNSHGTVAGPIWGFTTTLTSPNNVTASETEIFTDETTLIKWRFSGASSGYTGELTVADGTETNSYIPVYGLWMDDYTRSEMIYPEDMLADMIGGEITSLTYYISTPSSGSWAPATFNVYMREVEGTTLSSYYGSTDAEIVYSGALDGTGSTMVITLDEPYTYTGGNLLIGIEEPVEGTYHSCYFYGVTATGASASGYSSSALSAVTFTQRDFLPKTTFTCGGRGYRPEPSRSFLGFNVYYGQKNDGGIYEYTKANTELLTERQYLLGNLPYDMQGLDINVTAVYQEGESVHSMPQVLVKVSGYGKFTGTVTELISGAPIQGATVRFNGKDEFNNTVSFEGTTNASGVYLINDVKAGTYTGMATLEGMEPRFSDPVTLAYNTTETVNFTLHEIYKPVLSVYAEELEPATSKVSWSLNTTITGGGSGTVGGGSEFFENFDSSTMPAGWATIDADGDGSNWMLGSVAMSTGYGHNGSTDMILSKSYDNSIGALNPNNYLVSPQVTIGSGSTFSFYACAQDASWASEHFGVAVSTGSQTNAADFTMVNEWTMTAKGSGVMAPGRDGQTRDQGNWYEYTVDLGAYAGQQVYIAIRHFNCTDFFYLDVDDITLSNGSKDRSVQSYNVYRKAILKETALTDADSVMLVDNYTDTVYCDVHWGDMEPGLYQYGVSALYPVPGGGKGGNRAEVVFDFEGGSIPSDFTNTSSYPWVVVDGNGGKVMKSGNGGIASSTSEISLTYDYPTDGTFSFDAECMGEGTSTFWDKCTFYIDGEQQFQYGANHPGWNNYSYEIEAGEHTFTWSYTKDSSVNPTGDYFMVDNITLSYIGGGDSNDDPVTPITWSNILPKEMEAVVIVNAINAAGSTEGVAVNFVNDFETGTNFTAEMDETGTVVFDEFRKGNYTLSVTLPDYTSNYDATPVGVWNDTVVFDVILEEVFKPVEVLEVSGTGYARWTNMLPEEPERVAQRYHVTLEDIFQGETTDNFMQLNTENLIVGEDYTAAVAVVYTTGMSAFVTKTFTYLGCEATSTQVEDLEGHAACMDVVLTWNGGTTPTPGPGPTPPPTPPTGTTYDFESGLQGWTSLDADGDGFGWELGSSLMGTGYGHNSSSDLVLSQSYDNTYGPLTPNNFLVCPTKAEYTGISFYACAQDASWASEHFGVAVSTGNATASEFTMVQEWTMTAKGSGVMAPGRDGQTRDQGNWYEYTVDFSAYAGQQIWVAIRHFNSTDWFYLDVDDITLGVPEKGIADAETCGTHINNNMPKDMWDFVYSFNAAEGGQYGVACDGEFFYTSNWGYSSAAHNFYKYDLEGNMLEGFEIPGCGTLRGMTYDGQYFYGVANSATIYCVDLANHTLISSTPSAYGAMRCISYDPERDGFWVVGNWSGNLTLVDRSGAIVQVGPAPTSASDVAYYKDDSGVEHVYCFNNADNGVYDYNITTNTLGGQVFNYSSCPGVAPDASSGGCTVANYNGKACFIGDVQQSPNLIGIYELGEAQGGGGSASSNITPGKFNIFQDGVVIGATSDNYYTLTPEDLEEHLYEVYYVDANYNFSCAVDGVVVAAGTVPSVTNLNHTMDDPFVNLTWEGVAETYVIYRGMVQGTSVNLEVVGETTELTFTDELPAEAGYVLYVVQSVIGDCETSLQEEINNNNYVLIDYDAVGETEIVNAIYPNPTSGDLHINANGMTRVSVVNALGQMVYDAEVDADEVILNMAQYNAGIYMVNIVTVNGSTVKRVVVTK